MDLMEKVRRIISNRNPRHEWLCMSDKELMISAGLYETDFVTGTQGYNLAAILLFGKDEVIQSCVPGYVTDALCRKENLDRYDDRLIVKTNLIESYEVLMDFIAKHTPDKFSLVDNAWASVRDLISREIVSNILEIEFAPYPKNPILARFFVAVGLADTIGSGVRNLYKYTPIYTAGGKPELIEGDVFRINIPVTEAAVEEYKEENELTDRELVIVNMIKENNHLTVEEIMAALDISRATVFREYAKIRKKCGFSYNKKTGLWSVS